MENHVVFFFGLQEAILSYNQRYSNKWKFTAFHYYFNKVGLPAFELLLCYCVTFYPFLHTKYKLRDELQNEGSCTVNYCPTGNFGFVFWIFISLLKKLVELTFTKFNG